MPIIGYHFKSLFEIMSLVKSKIYLGMLATLPPSGGEKKERKYALNHKTALFFEFCDVAQVVMIIHNYI
jgi:hypothetical protein